MKGVIFNELEEMVRERFGEGAWDDILEATELRTKGGVFAGPKAYPDDDFLALVGTTCRLHGQDAPRLIREFGRFLFPRFVRRYPIFLVPQMTAKQFLKTVDGTIHVVVRKLNPDAGLPKFEYEDPASDRLVIRYQSPRRMCELMLGLVDGVADHFDERASAEEPRCLKRGDDHCRVELQFGGRR